MQGLPLARRKDRMDIVALVHRCTHQRARSYGGGLQPLPDHDPVWTPVPRDEGLLTR